MNSILEQLFLVTMLSSIVIAMVLGIKAICKDGIGSKTISFLWALVLLRLLVPFSVDSPVHVSDLFAKDVATRDEAPAEILSETISEAQEISDVVITANNTFDMPNITMETPETPATTITSPRLYEKIVKYIKSIGYEIIAIIIWLGVGVSIIFRSVLRLVFFNYRIKSTVVVSKKLYEAFCSAKSDISFSQSAKIVESENIDMPITCGLVYPRIIIPKKMVEAIDKDKLKLIIIHELIHIKRKDIFKNYLWLLAKAIHWFNPLVWIAYKMYLSDMELLCDENVIENIQNNERVKYSESLVAACKLLDHINRKNLTIMLSFCNDNTKLRRRIMNILEPKKQSRRVSYTIIALTAILIIGCFTTACQASNKSKYEAEKTMINELLDASMPASNDAFRDWEEYRMIDDIDVRVFLKTFAIDGMYLPEKNAFPEVVTEANGFDWDYAEKLVDYFMGDTYYHNRRTKSDFEKEINQFEADIKKINMTGTKEEFFDRYLDRLIELKDLAPIENKHMEISESEYDINKDLSLKSYTQNGNIARLEVWDSKINSYGMSYGRGELADIYQTFGMHNIDVADISSTYENSFICEALNQANDAVNALSQNMALSSIHVGKIAHIHLLYQYNEYDIYENSDKVCFSFIYTPMVDSIPSIYSKLMENEENQNDLMDYFDSNNVEFIQVVVDEDGIASFLWRNKNDIVDYTKDAATTISLDDAIATFKENVFDENKAWVGDPSSTVLVEIRYIHLAMMPMETSDGRFVSIPVYAFKGTETQGLDQVMYIMIINAIDGTVIKQN